MKYTFAVLAITAAIWGLGSCGDSTSAGAEADARGNAKAGKKVYETYCVLCHGDDGKLALNGAKDLTITALTFDERVELVTNGRNLMTPFKGILSEQEVEDVVAYSMTLNQ